MSTIDQSVSGKAVSEPSPVSDQLVSYAPRNAIQQQTERGVLENGTMS